MKKRIEVNSTDSSSLVATKSLNDDDTAWVDLLLSKTALIIATVVIIAAVYHLGSISSDMVKKNELEVIAIDLASNIDSVGTVHSGTDNAVKIYNFDSSAVQEIDSNRLNISVSGEYVSCTFSDDGNKLSAVRPLNYRTLPFSPKNLRNILTREFSADGNSSQPVNSIFPYTDLTEFLSIAAAEELSLNISKEVNIEKTQVFVTDGNEVNELEYVLVYQ
ncbi:MAG: hypothetical protein RBT65_06035 [Methanolobus sp.]|jgi:hypothetical protein|nr:hypothetical protein [Methanolobus sp.]